MLLDHKSCEKLHLEEWSYFDCITPPHASAVMHRGPAVSPVGKGEPKVDNQFPQDGKMLSGGLCRYCLTGITGGIS